MEESSKVKTRLISIGNHFTCIAQRCPATCCKGWNIQIDPETKARYDGLPGLYGRHIRFLIKKTQPPIFRNILGACPFYNAKHLCQFQQNGEEELMPYVCREFPRHITDYGAFCEGTLILSCPEAARLFLENLGRLSFEEAKTAHLPFWSINNDDTEFLDFLLAEREKLLDLLWQKEYHLPELWQAFYAYIHNQHDFLMRGMLDEMRGVTLSFQPEEQGEYVSNREVGYAFFRVRTIDRMLLSHVDYAGIQLREPKLYYLLKHYAKYFSDLTIIEADNFFDRGVKKVIAQDETYELKYRSYFSYNLQQLYLEAYDSYFMLRQLLFSILYVQLLMLFDLIDFLEKGTAAPQSRQQEILVLTERGLRHDPRLTDALLEVLREEFL